MIHQKKTIMFQWLNKEGVFKMRQYGGFVAFLLFFTFSQCKSQEKKNIAKVDKDTLYEKPSYGENEDLSGFILNKLVPVLKNCCDSLYYLGTGSYFLLSISKEGDVVDVKTIRFEYQPDCEDKVKAEFYNMSKWNPALRRNTPVASTIMVPVVIKWAY